jgi:hypothetical protein
MGKLRGAATAAPTGGTGDREETTVREKPAAAARNITTMTQPRRRTHCRSIATLSR